MAAVMANLDPMIVSIGAGILPALGRPVWVALAKQPDWLATRTEIALVPDHAPVPPEDRRRLGGRVR
jgi:hypothetical protein